jgi:hypothetical protein
VSDLAQIRDICVKEILARGDDYRTFGMRAARDAYFSICGKIPFPELRRISGEINVTANDPFVDISSLDPPVAGIRTVRYTDFSAGTTRLLVPKDGEEFEAQATVVTGTPGMYARESDGETLELYPVPTDSNDSIRLRYWSMPGIANPNDLEGDVANHVLVLPFEWEELLIWETVYRLYHYDNTSDSLQKAMMLVAPSQLPRMGGTKKIYSHEMGIIPRLWNDLLENKNTRENVGKRDVIRPEYRRYTHG